MSAKRAYTKPRIQESWRLSENVQCIDTSAYRQSLTAVREFRFAKPTRDMAQAGSSGYTTCMGDLCSTPSSSQRSCALNSVRPKKSTTPRSNL